MTNTNNNLEEVNAKLNSILEGIKLIPTLQSELLKELQVVFGEDDLIKEVANNNIDFDNVSNKDYIEILKIVYNITRDEQLNPDNVNISNDNEGLQKDEELYYNYEIKKMFADTYTAETARVTMTMFRKSALLEKELDKDLFDFNVMELEKFFISLNSTTIRSIQTYISRVERYIEFSIENGLKESEINFANVFDSSERIKNLLDKEALDNLIFPKEEILKMAMMADNAQDGVIIALLFDGISLKNSFEELINLKIDKFDEENQTITTENGRVIPLSTETAVLVKRASDQGDVYVSTTGETHRNYKVAQGENVLRGLRGRKTVSESVIRQRIYRTTENHGYHYMNATNISYNGRVHTVKEFIKEGYDIDDAVYKTLDRFGITKNQSAMFYLKRRVLESEN